MKTLRIYLRKDDINDATGYYVDTVAEAFMRQGYEVVSTGDARSIGRDDLVLVITMKAFLRVWIRNPRQRIVMWFQGIVPEEAQMLFKGHWSRRLRYHIWNLGERFVLSRSTYLLFVSRAMAGHYRSKYGFAGSNYYVMPCFNLPLDRTSFGAAGKYTSPSFVYAGTLSAWQCIDQTLELCRAIQEALPGSRFTILTQSVEQGRAMATRHGIRNAEVKYVPASEVGRELSRHKYGFLLREDTAVNNVATPTKLNSYMASGVLPVYSDVIGDFSDELSGIQYLIKVGDINRPEEAVRRILENERQEIRAAGVQAEFEKIFSRYYSREYHIGQLEQVIEHITE